MFGWIALMLYIVVPYVLCAVLIVMIDRISDRLDEVEEELHEVRLHLGMADDDPTPAGNGCTVDSPDDDNPLFG